MLAIIITKDLHNSTNILIFNLSLADFTVSAIVDSFTVVGTYTLNYLNEQNNFYENDSASQT